MCSKKRVQLVVLFLIAAALLAGTRADAAPWTTLAPTGAEPGASGVANVGKLSYEFTYEDPFFPAWPVDVYSGDLSVKLHGLTPNATYTVRADLGWWLGGVVEWAVTADALGKGEIVRRVFNLLGRRGQVWVGVYRDDGTTCVLSGYVNYR
jgi:hypothetical protein